MPLGGSPDPSASLSGAMAALNELWRTVGFDSIDNQPVKNPNPDELAKLDALLDDAKRHIVAARNGA